MTELDPVAMISQCLTRHEYLGMITQHLLKAVSQAPRHAHKDTYVHHALDEFIGADRLAMSFQRPIVLLYNEVVHVDVFLAMHRYFQQRACDIRNVWIVTTATLGLTDWYNNWLDVMGERDHGMRILEAPWVSRIFQDRFEKIRSAPTRQKFQWYYSMYGGSYRSDERDLLTAWFLDTDLGFVDYLAGFTGDREHLANYFETVTHFCDQAQVEKLLSRLDHKFSPASTKKHNEGFEHDGFQFQHDIRSFGQVIRETFNAQPWATITEKTLRPFLHLQIPLPLSGPSAQTHLVQQGFEFLPEIDYGYQNQGDLVDRCRGLEGMIRNLAQKYTLADLADMADQHRAIFQHNHDLIAQKVLFLHNIEAFKTAFNR